MQSNLPWIYPRRMRQSSPLRFTYISNNSKVIVLKVVRIMAQIIRIGVKFTKKSSLDDARNHDQVVK